MLRPTVQKHLPVALLYHIIAFISWYPFNFLHSLCMCTTYLYSFKYFWFLFLWVLKATTTVVPQHWQPPSGLLMTNDVPDGSEEPVPCIALSKNDSYVMSACGGKISLFNMMTFKVSWQLYTFIVCGIPRRFYSAVSQYLCQIIAEFQVMATFMSPPPSSTFLVFHPQDNNIIAIGMEDATIHFYNVRVDEVIS